MVKKILCFIMTFALLVTPASALALDEGEVYIPPVSTALFGYDISYPQCGTILPAAEAFAVVGVNNGLANTTNPCLLEQLTWASGSTGITAQPKVQLYVNTANPGGLNTPSWPSSGATPYGVCDHSNSAACAYQYGWNRAQEDATVRGVSSPASYKWWLDIELSNTWDTTLDGQTRNLADIEGMVAYFRSIAAGVGMYSTSYQFGQIVGVVPISSIINSLDSWIPGAASQSEAQTNCGLAPLTTGGKVILTQWTDYLDRNNSCI
ncbi:MAG: hypothetical protein NVS1B7_4620 [Candidatus Saccharimonadales bacterium]